MTYERWDIWEADVPFEDKQGHKRRPVLILSDQEMLVLSLKMTSHQPRYGKLPGEYEIMYWQEAGLSKPTVIQCSKRLQLNKESITNKRYGRLAPADVVGLQITATLYGAHLI